MSRSANILVIGVDGGGSGCRAAIGTREKGVLATATGGPANVTTQKDAAIKNVLAVVQAAAQKIGGSHADLEGAVAHLGLAGVMTPQDADQVRAEMPFADTRVTDDRPTVVTGALGPDDGYLLSVGTGTIVARKSENAFRYIGGWGFGVSDQASGAWLGRMVLEQVLFCHDGLTTHTDLTRQIFAEFTNDPNAISKMATSAGPEDYATFAPQIIAAAHGSDPHGMAVMKRGADYLVKAVQALGFAPGDPLCLTGGIGPHYAHFLPPGFANGQRAAKGTALDGAFRLALSLAEA